MRRGIDWSGWLDPGGWRRWWLVIWAVSIVWLLNYKWNAIHWFALSDTDDNLRFAQVRALLGGQAWFDLRQHRIDPPAGISVHWSRLVDLPIAGLMLLIQPFAGGKEAARWACALAPLLALGASLYATMLAARRLVAPHAFLIAAGIMLSAASAMIQWMPLRVDHHGWQLASLMFAIAGMADRRAGRGGATAGIATAASIAIGLELMPYLATIGALSVLWWVIDAGQAGRLRAYGASLAGGTVIGYAGFAPYDNAQALCDALTPVYLSTLLEAGALLFALGSLPFAQRGARIAAAAAAGAALAGIFAASWPQCLGRPERISPELDQIWFRHIREAKPLYAQSWRLALPSAVLPVIGLAGSIYAWLAARGTARAIPWALVALLSLFSMAMCLWQTRALPGSQLVGVLGATAIGVPLIDWTRAHRWMAMRVFGTVAAFVLVSGIFAGWIVREIPEQKSTYRRQVDLANRRCPTLPALAPIARLPAQTILTFVDLGPRLIAVTHHSAVAGPYHRNGDAILDVQHAFRAADPAVAHDVMRRHGARLLLLCPGMSESTIYRAENPKGFYVQLRDGKVPAWLAPLPLPPGSPFLLWRLVG